MFNNNEYNYTSVETKKALVVGLGISGISTAIALKQAGWEPVIIEKAPERRQGGYFLALFGLGRHAAKDLGILQYLHDRKGNHSENFEINRAGIVEKTLGFADIPGDFGPWMMLRGDIENAAFKALPEDVEVRYSTIPVDIWQNASKAYVKTKNVQTEAVTEEYYDLVVGADGVRSQVRNLAFGPDEHYIKDLGYMICAYELPGNPPGLKEGQGAILTEVGRSFWLFPFKDHPATVLFTYCTEDTQTERKKDPKKRIREVYGEPYGQYMEYALEQLDQAENVIFGTTDQVKMTRWHRGRVVLVGDAAWCPTLYSGMGATFGLGGADLLGKALQKYPDDIEHALNKWEKILRPKVERIQKDGANGGRKNFVAKNQKELDKRNKNIQQRRKLLKLPLLSHLFKYTPFIKERNTDLTKEI